MHARPERAPRAKDRPHVGHLSQALALLLLAAAAAAATARPLWCGRARKSLPPGPVQQANTERNPARSTSAGQQCYYFIAAPRFLSRCPEPNGRQLDVVRSLKCSSSGPRPEQSSFEATIPRGKKITSAEQKLMAAGPERGRRQTPQWALRAKPTFFHRFPIGDGASRRRLFPISGARARSRSGAPRSQATTLNPNPGDRTSLWPIGAKSLRSAAGADLASGSSAEPN